MMEGVFGMLEERVRLVLRGLCAGDEALFEAALEVLTDARRPSLAGVAARHGLPARWFQRHYARLKARLRAALAAEGLAPEVRA